MDLQVFNLYHILLLVVHFVVFTAITVLVFFTTRHNRRASKIVIGSLCFLSLLIHLTRLPFPPHGDTFPSSIQFIMPITVSAFSSFSFFFIFMWGNKTWKDFMFYVGVLGGLMAMFMPVAALDNPWYHYEVIRFMTAHALNGFLPLMMVLCGHHKLDYRYSWRAMFVLVFVLCIILLNEIFMMALGIVHFNDLNHFFSASTRNGALIFGPEPRGGFASWLFSTLTPAFARTAPFDITSLGISQGEVFYWPIIWIMFPGAVVLLPMCFLLCLVFDHRRFWRDVRWLWYTSTRQYQKRNEIPKRKLDRFKCARCRQKNYYQYIKRQDF